MIRDKKTGDSLQYAFIEFEDQKDCEQAYFKMQGVLIDDHRIHVDFSQSVSKLSDSWRTATNAKRSSQRGGFGGISNLEKRRQYRAAEAGDRRSKYGMVFDKDDIQSKESSRPSKSRRTDRSRSRSRSRSPPRYTHRDRSPRRRDGYDRGPRQDRERCRSPRPRHAERDYGRPQRRR